MLANIHPTVYTDGSCHTQLKIGAWVAIIFIGNKKVLLSGKEESTTNNRMELTAVIKAVEYLQKNYIGVTHICLYTDSQYVAGLQARQTKLVAAGFVNSKGLEMTNATLVKLFFAFAEDVNLSFVKVMAHQKKNDIDNYNIEADILSRKIVREAVESLSA